jgi:hypothetical protein
MLRAHTDNFIVKAVLHFTLNCANSGSIWSLIWCLREHTDVAVIISLESDIGYIVSQYTVLYSLVTS